MLQEQEDLKKRQQEIEKKLQAKRLEEEQQEERERERKQQEVEEDIARQKAEMKKKKLQDKLSREQTQQLANQDSETKQIEKDYASLKLPEKTQKDKIVKLDNDLDDSPIANDKFKSTQNDPLKLPEHEEVQQKKELIKKPIEYQPPLKLNFDDDNIKKKETKEIKDNTDEVKSNKSRDVITDRTNKVEAGIENLESNSERKKATQKQENQSQIKGENSAFISPIKGNSSGRKNEKDDDDRLMFDGDEDHKQDNIDLRKSPTVQKTTKIEPLIKKEVLAKILNQTLI